MDLALIASLSNRLFVFGMLIFSEVGRRIGIARLARDPEGLTKGAGAAEAAVFGLLGLLIAFTFSGAASRFEDRRHLIVAEANAIGTAYLRIDLLPARRTAGDEGSVSPLSGCPIGNVSGCARSDRHEGKARCGCGVARGYLDEGVDRVPKAGGTSDKQTMLLLPALNEMIDITTTRAMATQNHPPLVIFLLLGGLSLVGALLVGYGTSANKDRSWFHTVVFAAILSLTVYVIVDLEFPRLGLIRVDAADQVLIDLRKSMQ